MRFLGPADLRAADSRTLEEILECSECVVAFGDGHLHRFSAAALLFSDYAVLRTDATLSVEAPEAQAAAVWRLGRGVLRWTLAGCPPGDVVDEITGSAPDSWWEEWKRHRSVIALDTAAALVRARGGDALERAAFARLFAIGEPQSGLRAFLQKTRPPFGTI
jgi:hypothetical protein